jgi:hypothetical protein
MLQEIITYMLVGAAITLAVVKAVYKFSKKKKSNIDFKKETFTMEHNCSECAADCVLRNAPISSRKENKELCDDLHVKSH